MVAALLVAACALGAWAVVLAALGRTRGFESAVKKQHWVQACAQSSVYLYWGWYWREVYRDVPLLIAQLLFAYAFDVLLQWSRGRVYRLGFGPFPVILSINLFLWFKEDWFYLQLLMVAVGLLAKELVTWEKDGRRAHVFNPSSFPLAAFSIVLIATRSTSLTWGYQIATTQGDPPGMFAFLFASGLAGQYLFGVTTMTMSAAVSMYVAGRVWLAVTGHYFFAGETIPISVFLGMHLLFTDPSTAPKTELGRIGFGALYAALVMLAYAVLEHFGEATFYDKLLPVPLLNLAVRAIDRAVRSKTLARFDPSALGKGLPPRRRNLVYMGIWAMAFGAMSWAGGLGGPRAGHAAGSSTVADLFAFFVHGAC